MAQSVEHWNSNARVPDLSPGTAVLFTCPVTDVI